MIRFTVVVAGLIATILIAGVRAGAGSLPDDPTGRMFAAIEAGDAAALDRALAEGADSCARDANGDPAVQLAIRLGNPVIVRQCLDYCADWRATGKLGQNAVVAAVVFDRPEALQALLEGGAGPDALVSSPQTAGFTDLIKPTWLRDQLRYDRGLTPLMLASAMGNEAVVRVLLEHGARRTVFTRRYRMPPVSFSCNGRHPRITQLLVGRDPDLSGTQRRVVISLGRQRLSFYRGGQLLVSNRCSTGRRGYKTPTGTFIVTSKHQQWISNLYHVPMPYFIRLNASAIGMHSGVVPNYPASHGCIRLPSRTAMRLFREVDVGDPVEIVP
jgi:hypothetical protein